MFEAGKEEYGYICSAIGSEKNRFAVVDLTQNDVVLED